MLTARTETERPATPRLVPPPVAAPESEASLRAELEELNESLRALKSTDFAVRAYFEMWLAFLAGSVAAKMLFDWHVTHQKPPTVAFPVALLGVAFVADSVYQRVRQRRLAREEEARIRRQRELREKLGLNDAPVPAMDEPQIAVA